MMIRGLVCLCAALPWTAAAAMYKWVDEKGVTHYSESPPPDGKASASSCPRHHLRRSSGDVQTWKDRDLDFRRRRLEQEQAQEKATQRRSTARAARGKVPRIPRRLDILQSERPVYHVNERGEQGLPRGPGARERDRAVAKQAETYCDGQ